MSLEVRVRWLMSLMVICIGSIAQPSLASVEHWGTGVPGPGYPFGRPLGSGVWGRASTVAGDYLRWLGALRLDTAQAAYEEALAAQERIRAATLAKTVMTLKKDLYTLEGRIRELRNAAASIEARATSLNSLLLGNCEPRIIAAANYLLKLLPEEKLESFFTQEIPATVRGDFFVLHPYRNVTDPETGEVTQVENTLTPWEGGNIWEFLDWLAKPGKGVNRGSEGHHALIKIRQVMIEAANSWISDIDARRVAQEDRKLSIWGPVYSGSFGLPARSID